jgi:hypothetical protein
LVKEIFGKRDFHQLKKSVWKTERIQKMKDISTAKTMKLVVTLGRMTVSAFYARLVMKQQPTSKGFE